QKRLEALPEVSPADLVEAEAAIEQTDAARQQAAQHVERLQKLEFQAGQWTELQGRLAGVRRKREDAERLLADAAGIECDAARLQELREVLPKVQTVMEQRSQFAESERQSGELTRQKEKLADQRREQDDAIMQARQKRFDLQQR